VRGLTGPADLDAALADVGATLGNQDAAIDASTSPVADASVDSGTTDASGSRMLRVQKLPAAQSPGRVFEESDAIDFGSVCERKPVSGETVTLYAEPRGGFVFDGWSGACSGTSPECAAVVPAGARMSSSSRVFDRRIGSS
jgi:uncharacterized repeat protein (TIGR02543 family)